MCLKFRFVVWNPGVLLGMLHVPGTGGADDKSGHRIGRLPVWPERRGLLLCAQAMAHVGWIRILRTPIPKEAGLEIHYGSGCLEPSAAGSSSRPAFWRRPSSSPLWCTAGQRWIDAGDNVLLSRMSQPPTNSPLMYTCGMVGQSLYSLMAWRSSWSSRQL